MPDEDALDHGGREEGDRFLAVGGKERDQSRILEKARQAAVQKREDGRLLKD